MPKKRSYGKIHLRTEVPYRSYDALKARVRVLEIRSKLQERAIQKLELRLK